MRMLGGKLSCCFLVLFVLNLVLSNDGSDTEILARKRIAVCVSGQLSRWIPETAVKFLLEHNQQYEFTFFYNLQYHTSNMSYIFSTDPHISFHPTKFVTMKQSDVFDYIHTLYGHLNNTNVASITFVPPRSLHDWETNILRHKADRISQYATMQHVILNFYSHQVRCIHQVQEYEQLRHTKFQYVLQTREDIYYFQPVSLDYLVSHLKNPDNLEDTGNLQCDLITKDCLQWGGMNMRWQLMTREASNSVMLKRIEYYFHLMNTSQVIYNPEQYESQQMKFYKLRICEFLANYIPNAVGRHVKDDQICFLKPETIDNCIPSDNVSYVQQNFCHKLPSHFRAKNVPGA
jgi:hypothetical protein